MFQFDYCVNEPFSFIYKNPYEAVGHPALPGQEIKHLENAVR
jgi:hypothetical protein